MARDHRMVIGGSRTGYTCENAQFHTDTRRRGSKRHGRYSSIKGSVFAQPLAASGGYTLWLEHVISKYDGSRSYWLMWYDSNGTPTIPLSGIMQKPHIQEMTRLLGSLIP